MTRLLGAVVWRFEGAPNHSTIGVDPVIPQATTTALVIPGRNCARTIERCLAAVAPLLARGSLSEILFVNDHSTDDTRARVAGFPSVRLIESSGQGAGAARNAGWRMAASEWIWFIDADCVAAPDALERLHRCASELGADAIGGSYSNLQTGDLLADLIHEEMVARHEAMGSDVTFAITANLLCRRAVLEQLSGFDESLKLAQDLDLAYRILERGFRLRFDAGSRVGHFHETHLLRYLVKQGRQGYWRMHLYARHPRRMTGDSYSGLMDYAQPPLALVSALAVAAALGTRRAALKTASRVIGGGSLALLAALQLPYTLRLLSRTADPRMLAYAPMAMLRSGFRGLGMALGAAEVGLLRRRRESYSVR